MRLGELMDEIAVRLSTFTGLRVSAYPPPTVVPPAGVVSYPDKIEYDQTYGRGVDRVVGLPVVLVVGKATDRAARDTVTDWTDGSGPHSVKVALEAPGYLSCDEVSVTECSFDVVTIASIDYLAAMFNIDAIGPGA